MKKSILFTFVISLPIYSAFLKPGCIDRNSDGIARTLLFMQIEQGQMELAINLLDHDTVDLRSHSGKTVYAALQEAKDKYKYNITPVLQHLEKLKKQKEELVPAADEPV